MHEPRDSDPSVGQIGPSLAISTAVQTDTIAKPDDSRLASHGYCPIMTDIHLLSIVNNPSRPT
jgi:hypothetical protein